MSHADLLANLLPPVSYNPNGERLQPELGAEGAALDSTQASAESLNAGIFPSTAGDLITDWERICGLIATGTYPERIAAVKEKLLDLGGLSIPYFIALASRMGYTITIEEPQPTRAGTSCAGDVLTPLDALWYSRVIVDIGERIYVDSDAVIEAVLFDLKPAHTQCEVIYMTTTDRLTESGTDRLNESSTARISSYYWVNS